MNYEQAASRIKTARNMEAGKPLANNTRLFRRGTDYAVQLHSTDIVTIHPDSTYTLNSGGWLTPTTKSRINDYIPGYGIYQRNGLWYIDADGQTYNYVDGLRIDANGKPVGAEPSTGDLEKRKRRIDRAVAKYVKGYMAHITANGLDDPGNGDCWPCLFAINCTPKVGRGQECMGFDHYVAHMDERYYVPSMLWRAIMEQGYRDPALTWALIKADCERGREPWIARNALTRFLGRRKAALLEETKGTA